MLNYATTADCFNPAMEGGHHSTSTGPHWGTLWTPGEIDFHLHSHRATAPAVAAGVAWRGGVKHPPWVHSRLSPSLHAGHAPRTRVAPILGHVAPILGHVAVLWTRDHGQCRDYVSEMPGLESDSE